MLTSSRNTLIGTPRILSDQISGQHSPIKLTCKINHHTYRIKTLGARPRHLVVHSPGNFNIQQSLKITALEWSFWLLRFVLEVLRKCSLRTHNLVGLVTDHGKRFPSHWQATLEKKHCRQELRRDAQALSMSVWEPTGAFPEGFSCLLISDAQSLVNMDLYCGAERLCRAFSALVGKITLSNIKWRGVQDQRPLGVMTKCILKICTENIRSSTSLWCETWRKCYFLISLLLCLCSSD